MKQQSCLHEQMFWEIHSTRSERFFKSRDFAHREIPYSKKLQLFFPFVCQFDFVTAAFQANNYQQCWTCRWVGNKEVIYGCIENFFAHFMTFYGSKEVRYECNLLKAANQVFENHFYPFSAISYNRCRCSPICVTRYTTQRKAMSSKADISWLKSSKMAGKIHSKAILTISFLCQHQLCDLMS